MCVYMGYNHSKMAIFFAAFHTENASLKNCIRFFNYIFETVIANILLINSTVLFYLSPCYMLMINTIQMPVIQNFKRNVILRKNSHMNTTTALFSSFFNYIFNFAGKKTTLAYHLMVILSSLSFMFEFKYPVPSICDILS